MSDMDGIVAIANLLKDRDNPDNFTISTVDLINKSPITFKASGRIFINNEYENMTLSNTAYNLVISELTSLGSKFIAIPVPDGNMWFIIDKVVI